MFSLRSVFLGAVIAVTAIAAQAQRGGYVRGYELVYRDNWGNDREFSGRNPQDDVVFLKRDLQSVYQHVDLRRAQLQYVTLRVKSRMGRGQVRLRIGDQYSYPATIPGNPYDYDNPRVTYDVTIDTRNFPQQIWDFNGPWQLEFQGNVRLASIIVGLNEGGWGPGPGPGPRPPGPRPGPRPEPPPHHGLSCRHGDIAGYGGNGANLLASFDGTSWGNCQGACENWLASNAHNYHPGTQFTCGGHVRTQECRIFSGPPVTVSGCSGCRAVSCR